MLKERREGQPYPLAKSRGGWSPHPPARGSSPHSFRASRRRHRDLSFIRTVRSLDDGRVPSVRDDGRVPSLVRPRSCRGGSATGAMRERIGGAQDAPEVRPEPEAVDETARNPGQWHRRGRWRLLSARTGGSTPSRGRFTVTRQCKCRPRRRARSWGCCSTGASPQRGGRTSCPTRSRPGRSSRRR